MLAGLAASSMDAAERSTEISMEELAALTDTAGADAVALVLQTRQTPDPRSFLGSGKLKEIREIVEGQECDLVVVDNMAEVDRRPFIAALTNGLPKMQAAYRAMLPSPLTDDSHIAAVRIFATREEYLAYVGSEMKWSAALWSPQHRELVLYTPRDGWEALLRTVWHEALHQHLDYACSMLQTPPWFNEGHAVLFEHTHFDMAGKLVFDLDVEAVDAIQPNAAALAEMLPMLLMMDYPEFYAGSSEERRLKYQLAWSLAYFLQIGAPKVRFQPFKDFRADIMRAVVRTKDRNTAMRTVLTGEMCDNLVGEWLAFWKKQ